MCSLSLSPTVGLYHDLLVAYLFVHSFLTAKMKHHLLDVCVQPFKLLCCHSGFCCYDVYCFQSFRDVTAGDHYRNL